MRFPLVALAVLPSILPIHGQNVTLRNVSFPFTSLEVGNTVEVLIEFAQPDAPVTVVQNGDPPVFMGMTNASGTFSIQAEETEQFIGQYSQEWFVNGVPANPTLIDLVLLEWAPTLPNFTVHRRKAPSVTPEMIPGVLFASCNGLPQGPSRWTWQPLSYYSWTTYGSAPVQYAADLWSLSQWKIPLYYWDNPTDISVYDGALPAGTFGRTINFNQTCTPCYGYIGDCNGACMDSAAMFATDIILAPWFIDLVAAEANVSETALAQNILTHEFGHALQVFHSFPVDGDENGTCSQLDNIMYHQGPLPFLCGINAPTSKDISAFDQIYPLRPMYCPSGQALFCDLIQGCIF